MASDGGMPAWAISAGTVFDRLSRGICCMRGAGGDWDNSAGSAYQVVIIGIPQIFLQPNKEIAK